jgi:transposase
MNDRRVISDETWAVVAPLLPSTTGKRGGQYREHRRVVEGIVHRFRTGCPWRDVPREYGPWQTLWKRHAAWSADGTWARILGELQAHADALGELDWVVAVDSSIVRAHQHAAGARRTGGFVEPQEAAAEVAA